MPGSIYFIAGVFRLKVIKVHQCEHQKLNNLMLRIDLLIFYIEILSKISLDHKHNQILIISVYALHPTQNSPNKIQLQQVCVAAGTVT